jgi:transmembrane sensor
MALQPSQITREAADWVVRLRSPDRPANCEPLFADWLRVSPVHVREYLRAVEVWEGLAHPDVGGRRSRDDLVREAAAQSVAELPTATLPVRADRQGLRWRRVGFAVALTAVFVLAYVGWQRTAVIKVATGLGEQHSKVLPDHSVVELNTQSEIRVAFTAAERRVELIRGEAFFDVAKDPSRPFIVVTDLATARAIGTRFSVYRSQTGTIVTVAEGRVLVRDKQAASDPTAGEAALAHSNPTDAVEVTPGIQAEAQPGRPVLTRQANVERTFAWRDRRLVFDGQPLSAVVAEFNRYNSPPLVVSAARLREQRISGVFGANDPESLLDFLVKVDHIAITHDANGAIHIGGDAP